MKPSEELVAIAFEGAAAPPCGQFRLLVKEKNGKHFFVMVGESEPTRQKYHIKDLNDYVERGFATRLIEEVAPMMTSDVAYYQSEQFIAMFREYTGKEPGWPAERRSSTIQGHRVMLASPNCVDEYRNGLTTEVHKSMQRAGSQMIHCNGEGDRYECAERLEQIGRLGLYCAGLRKLESIDFITGIGSSLRQRGLQERLQRLQETYANRTSDRIRDEQQFMKAIDRQEQGWREQGWREQDEIVSSFSSLGGFGNDKYGKVIHLPRGRK
jgi:hypothetical protein